MPDISSPIRIEPKARPSSRFPRLQAGSGRPQPLTDEMKRAIRVPYGLRHVDPARMQTVLPLAGAPVAGDLALAQLEKIGNNTRLELANGRPCPPYVGDWLAGGVAHARGPTQFVGCAGACGE